MPTDPCQSTHIRSQDIRNYPAAVFLLVVFKYGEESSADCQSGAVERVDEDRPAFLFLAVADLRPARLEIFAVRARADFSVSVLAGQPDFQVVGLRRSKSHVAGTQLDHAVGDLQPFEDFFGVPDHAFQLIIRSLRFAELDQFHFIELVLANEPAYVLTIRARFPAKTRSVGDIFDRQS